MLEILYFFKVYINAVDALIMKEIFTSLTSATGKATTHDDPNWYPQMKINTHTTCLSLRL